MRNIRIERMARVFIVLACMLVPVGAVAENPEIIPGVLADTQAESVSIVTNGAVEVRAILSTLAQNAGLGLKLAPGVQGQVDVHLENVSLAQALTTVLDPLKLGYEIEHGVIIVSDTGMITRWYTFDYPVTEREGKGELQVSAGNSGSSGGGSGGGSSSKSENKSQISSRVVMNVWPDVMQAMSTLIFDGAGEKSESGELSSAISISDGAGRTLIANPMASVIMVTAERSRVDRAGELLQKLKTSLQRQVAIEVKIMEVALDADTQTGINWNLLSSGDIDPSLNSLDAGNHVGNEYFQFIFNNVDISGVMEAIAMSGDLHTVASPRVTTLNNQKAVVRIVREDIFFLAQVEPGIVSNGVATEAVVNYTPQAVPVGVVLDVTAQVGQDSMITLNVHPTITDVVNIAESPNKDTAPILSVRELDTVGKIHSGETLVLAGLISNRNKLNKSGIPFLKDLPFVGYLFGKTRNQTYNIELIIMLTPVILTGQGNEPWAEICSSLETTTTL